jgi:hypothetical protein
VLRGAPHNTARLFVTTSSIWVARWSAAWMGTVVTGVLDLTDPAPARRGIKVLYITPVFATPCSNRDPVFK